MSTLSVSRTVRLSHRLNKGITKHTMDHKGHDVNLLILPFVIPLSFFVSVVTPSDGLWMKAMNLRLQRGHKAHNGPQRTQRKFVNTSLRDPMFFFVSVVTPSGGRWMKAIRWLSGLEII